MKKAFKYLIVALVFTLLTAISQVGGIVYLFTLYIASVVGRNFRFKKILIFFVTYTLLTFIIVPLIAPYFGRERITETTNLKSANLFYKVLNRNYVNKKLHSFLLAVSDDMKKSNPEIEIRHLDACFPFFNGFPMLPHLSHNDGRKIDFSLVYENEDGRIINKGKSFSGYGVFEPPIGGELNQIEICKQNGFHQYDFPKYLSFGKMNKNLVFSETGTRTLMRSMLKQENLDKIFIEPHLKSRMKLDNKKIRFHGCNAVRHDDHIHLQVNQE